MIAYSTKVYTFNLILSHYVLANEKERTSAVITVDVLERIA
jgi:hypothetical protein